MLTPDEATAARMAKLTERSQRKGAALREAAARALSALRAHSAKARFAGLDALAEATGVGYDEYGTTLEEGTPAAIFPDAATLDAAIEAASCEAQAIALPLLVALAPDAAEPILLVVLPADEDHFPMNYLEQWITLGTREACATFVRGLAPERAAPLWLAGKIGIDALSDEALAPIAVAALASAARQDRLGYFDNDHARRVLATVESLASAEAKLDLLRVLGDDLLVPEAVYALAIELIGELGAARHGAAGDLVAAIRSRYEDAETGTAVLLKSAATSALLAFGHRPTTERLAANLAPLAARLAPPWDPHHTVPELREPIRATFALDPATASARFAPFFGDAAVATDAGAKIAHDILRLGLGQMTFHGTTRLETGESWLVCDGGWPERLAGLVSHPRLKEVVREARRLFEASQ